MMDNVREKLVELLCGVQDYGEKTKHLNGSYAFVERNDNRTIADYLIDNGVTIQQWIPVTERLPEKNTANIVADQYGDVFQCLYAYDGWDLWEGNEVVITHWMPLPHAAERRVSGDGVC